jgi:competence transcription factor ComK
MIDAMCRECIKTFLFQKKISQDGIWVQHLLEKHPKELEKKSTDIQLINTEVRKIKNLFHINNRQII